MPTPQTLKQNLLTHCRQQVDDRITMLTTALKAITDARDGETKSSAGDKFETGRAMMQIEEAKLNRQLAEAATDRQTLDLIKITETMERVASGALVATNRGNYFLGAALGKVRLNDRVFFCTSLASPVGQQLLGKEVGDTFTFNDLEFKVLGMV